MNPQQLAGLLGFLFVAAWAALGIGDAILCLIGATVFYATTPFFRGELDLAACSSAPHPSATQRIPLDDATVTMCGLTGETFIVAGVEIGTLLAVIYAHSPIAAVASPLTPAIRPATRRVRRIPATPPAKAA